MRKFVISRFIHGRSCRTLLLGGAGFIVLSGCASNPPAQNALASDDAAKQDTVDAEVAVLRAGSDVVRAFAALRRLAPLITSDARAKRALIDFVQSDAPQHVRTHALAKLAEFAEGSDAELDALFRRTLTREEMDYWAVKGLANTSGKRAYPVLCDVAHDAVRSVEVRAHAIKCLSRISGQLFDRELPADPGHWSLEQLRLSEITTWRASGFPDGPGYPKPPRDPGLDQPRTRLELAAAALDEVLSQLRDESFDPAAPSNLLVPASRDDIEAIVSRWPLPPDYREFLTRFSPEGLWLRIDHGNAIVLFGASELLTEQRGYGFEADRVTRIAGWPEGFLVIGSRGGDPYVLDLRNASAREVPVRFAMHDFLASDDVEEEFRLVAPSFVAWLEQLAVDARRYTDTRPSLLDADVDSAAEEN